MMNCLIILGLYMLELCYSLYLVNGHYWLRKTRLLILFVIVFVILASFLHQLVEYYDVFLVILDLINNFDGFIYFY